MDTSQLRALQSPLKEQYRERPETAVITLNAEGELADESITCNIATGKALVQAGLHPAAGGDGLAACSGDMLLEALVACAGVTLKAVATSLGIQIKRGVVRAEGQIDVRGTLGIDKQAPVGFKSIQLTFDLGADANADQLTALQKLTERYCVIYRTLRNPPPIDVKLNSRAAGGIE